MTAVPVGLRGASEPSWRTPRLELHFRLTLMIVILIGYVMLFAAELYPWWSLPLCLAVVGYSAVKFRTERALLLPEGVWTMVTVTLVLVCAAWMLMGDMEPATAIGVTIFVLPLVKLLNVKRERDYFQLFALAFGQILLAAVLTLKIYFGIVLVLYLWCVMWALILFTFRKAAANHADPP